MSVPGVFKLVRVSIMSQSWHLPFMHYLLPEMVGLVEVLVLTNICLRVGSCLHAHIVVLLNKCLAAGMLR